MLPDDVEDSLVVARLFKELDEVKARLRASDTNRLWLDTYLQWYNAFLSNLHNERLGQWAMGCVQILAETAASVLHLWSSEKRHKVGHVVFVRIKPSGWRNGFVVRRFATGYGGISRDLAIEQSMMGAIKGRTGLIRGHEFTELNYLTWQLNRPVISKVDNTMKEMTGYSSKIGQTSVKVLRKSRIGRDYDDEQTIHDFFTQILVLSPEAPTQLKSIATGIISPKSVNVHLAYEIGTRYEPS